MFKVGVTMLPMRKWLGRFKVFAGFGNWVNAIVNAILHWKILVGTVAAIGTTIWAVVDGYGWFIVTLAAIFVFVVVLWAWIGIVYLFDRKKKPQPTGALDDAGAQQPGWGIREVFFHVYPDILQDESQGVWDEVGQYVLDTISTNGIRAWASQIDVNGDRLPSSEISDDYWSAAKFTYQFLRENSEQECHVTNPNKQNLADLRFNKSKAETAFKPWLTPLHEAARIAYEQTRQTLGMWFQEYLHKDPAAMPGVLAQKICGDGDVEIFGRYPPSTIRERIPEDDANTFQFNDEATEMYDSQNENRRYIDLYIKRTDFDRRLSSIVSEGGF